MRFILLSLLRKVEISFCLLLFLTITLSGQPSELFFSEYIEGSSNNKAIEIYNGTGSSVNLSTYTLELYSNGSLTVSQSMPLSGTLLNNDVYVIAHGSANATILAQADATNNSVINWNGDDAIVLKKSGVIIDVFGQVGNDPGSEWGTNLQSTADNTLRRKGNICSGDINGSNTFTPSTEWDGFALDSFDGLGSHALTVPTFTQLGPYNVGDIPGTLPTTSNNGVIGTWNPSTISTASPGTTSYIFTPSSGSCVKDTMDVTVNAVVITPTFDQLGPYCIDDTPDALPTSSTNGITGTWDPATINTASAGLTTYTFTADAGQGAGNTTMDITVNPKPTLTLAAASVSSASCGDMVSVNISVNNTFEDINSLQFSVNWDPAQLEYVGNTPLQIGGGDPVLGALDVSNGNFVYTWIDPAGIDGEDLANATVILTLNFKVKGSSGTANVNITDSPTPMEVANSSFCIATPSADNAVSISLDNTTTLVGDDEVCVDADITLTGSGTPAAVNPYVSSNTAVATIDDAGELTGLSVGMTTVTYTNNNGCTATKDITVSECLVCSATLTREPGTLCVGEEGVLTVNINGGFGNYSVQIDTDGNLATAEITNNDYEDGAEILVSPTSTTTYTLISVIDNGNDDQVCTLGGAVTINVDQIIEPAFFPAGTFCQGATPTILPTTSNNGIMGTWNPSSINTSTPGTYTFVFTPNPGQCADTASMKVRVVAKREPTFTVTTTYCEGDTPDALPGVSFGGDTGTWNPSSINTSTPGTFTFVFTPTPGACVDTASIKVTVNAKVEPTFSILGSYCQGQTPANLPTTSNNGVAGTWNPSTISTATPGTITYVFTPDNATCTDTASVKVVVSQPVTVEAGTPQTLCVNQTLDLNDLNASISGGATTGTWSSSGTGSFTGGTAFGTATAYVPSTADKAAGTITLTLTSADPDGPCPAQTDTVVITIRNFNCSTFPWNGGK